MKSPDLVKQQESLRDTFLTYMHVFVHKLLAIKVSCCRFADFLNERMDEFE